MKKEGIIIYNKNLKRYDIGFLKKLMEKIMVDFMLEINLSGTIVKLLNGSL